MVCDENDVTGAFLQRKRKERQQRWKSPETLITSGFFEVRENGNGTAAEKWKKLLFCNKFVIIFLRFAHKKIGKGREKGSESAI